MDTCWLVKKGKQKRKPTTQHGISANRLSRAPKRGEDANGPLNPISPQTLLVANKAPIVIGRGGP